MPTPRATGRCHCGGVRFEVHGKLRDVVICHCDDCRRHHGHASAHTRCQRSEVTFLSDDGLRWYDTSATGRRGFCGTCGSVLFFQRIGTERIAINAGVLDQPTGLRAAMHLFVPDKADYYELGDDGLPRRDGMPLPEDDAAFRYS